MTTTSHTTLPSVTLAMIGETIVQTVDARDLHASLAVGRDFTNWIKARIAKYGFERDIDFTVVGSPDRANQTGRGGDRRSVEYHLTLDMAKEVAMVENNDHGRAIRRYFIECERQLRERGAEDANRILEAYRAQLVSLSEDLGTMQATVAEHEDRISAAERDVTDIKAVVKIVPAMFAIIERLNEKLSAPAASAAREEPSPFVTAFEILEMAGYSADEREAGTLQTITKRMVDFCAERGVVCPRQSKAFGPGRLHLIPRKMVVEWLLGEARGLDIIRAQITRMRRVKAMREARKTGRKPFQVVTAPGVTPDPVV